MPAVPAAESAACCADVELECLFLLCGHAALAPQDIPLLAATLDWLAARMGYPHRHAYAAWHQRALLYAWFSAGFTLNHWLAVQRLVAPTPEAAAAGPQPFLAACAPGLTATLVYGQKEGDLQQLAQYLQQGG